MEIPTEPKPQLVHFYVKDLELHGKTNILKTSLQAISALFQLSSFIISNEGTCWYTVRMPYSLLGATSESFISVPG